MSIVLDDPRAKIIHDSCVTTTEQVPPVDLVVTSPPYNVGIEYGDHDDAMNYDGYLEFSRGWLSRCFGWLKDHGRICVNIPFETSKGSKRTTYADYVQIMKGIGFNHYTTAIWTKGNCPRAGWGCYDDKTRVLTNDGLKYFKDVNTSIDLFATINLDSGKVEYQKAFDKIQKHYVGAMYKFSNSATNLLVTPNHNMIQCTGNNRNTMSLVSADNVGYLVTPSSNSGCDDGVQVDKFVLPSIKYGKYNLAPVEIDMNDWLMFLGIFLTDGYCEFGGRGASVRIYQTKKTFLKEITDLLDRLPFDFHHRLEKGEYYTCNRQLASYLYNFGKKSDRTVPGFIDGLPTQQKRIFVDWMFKGDGTRYKNGDWRYFCSTSEAVIGKIVNYLTQLGFGLRLTTRRPDGKEHFLAGNIIKMKVPIHLVWVRKKKNKWVDSSQISIEQYNGAVYCVSVPNKTLLVERDGKLTWCGNSWMSAKAPLIMPPAEAIIIMSKGEWKREDADGKETDITKAEFVKWADCVWQMHCEDRVRLGHPAPFPLELPRRCIKLLSFVGDTVLDTFLGSGSTMVSAFRVDRKCIGFDIDENYCNLAMRRIKREIKIKESYIF